MSSQPMVVTITDRARQLARTLLYEGYVLYPYRSSSLKNQRRITFGTLYPEDCAVVKESGERSYIQAEVLLESDEHSTVAIQLEFLQTGERPDEQSATSRRSREDERGTSGCVDQVVERTVSVELKLKEILDKQHEVHFGFPGVIDEWRSKAAAPKIDCSNEEKVLLQGRLTISAARCAFGILRISAHLRNVSTTDVPPEAHAMISAHLIFSACGGKFISQLDPPLELREYSEQCQNVGIFPVLVGNSGKADTLLCSPIALDDNPQVAPESAGDFFDNTEIDELLTLRVLTLSDEEKNEIRVGDPRAREILERTEMLTSERLANLHGAVRNLKALTKIGVIDSGQSKTLEFKKGDRVRIIPKRRADVMDLALAGCVGIIEAVEVDYDDRTHLAVVMEDDPGADLGFSRQPGHRFFFATDEVELMPRMNCEKSNEG